MHDKKIKKVGNRFAEYAIEREVRKFLPSGRAYGS